jgi:Zn-dependent protease/CBS domain-containing protein
VPGRGFRVLTVAGIPIYVSPFVVLFVIYLAVTFVPVAENRIGESSGTHTFALGLIAALLTIVFIALHELGHALVAKGLRFEVEAITVYGFVGLTEFRPEPQTPSRSFLVSVSGPLVNVVFGVAATVGYSFMDPNTDAGFIVWSIAYVNVALAIFNLLPGLPLDGGQVFASGIWKVTGSRSRATTAAAYAGFVVAGALAILALAYYSGGGQTLIALVFAAMLGMGAAQALKRNRIVERLPGLTAGGVARKAVTVDANLPLSEALRRAEMQGVTAVIVTDSSGRPWAVMNGAAVDAVPPDRRPWTTINAVSRPIEESMRIPEGLGGEELLEKLAEASASEYVVQAPDGRLTGVLVMVDLVARLDPAAAARLARR